MITTTYLNTEKEKYLMNQQLLPVHSPTGGSKYIPATCPWHKWLYWAWTHRRDSSPSTLIWWCQLPPRAGPPLQPSPWWWSQLEIQEFRTLQISLPDPYVTRQYSKIANPTCVDWVLFTHHHPSYWPWQFSQRSQRCCCTLSIKTKSKNIIIHTFRTYAATLNTTLPLFKPLKLVMLLVHWERTTQMN